MKIDGSNCKDRRSGTRGSLLVTGEDQSRKNSGRLEIENTFLGKGEGCMNQFVNSGLEMGDKRRRYAKHTPELDESRHRQTNCKQKLDEYMRQRPNRKTRKQEISEYRPLVVKTRWETDEKVQQGEDREIGPRENYKPKIKGERSLANSKPWLDDDFYIPETGWQTKNKPEWHRLAESKPQMVGYNDRQLDSKLIENEDIARSLCRAIRSNIDEERQKMGSIQQKTEETERQPEVRPEMGEERRATWDDYRMVSLAFCLYNK